MILMQGYTGQPPTVTDWAKDKMVASANYRVHACVVANKRGSGASFYVQVFDCINGDVTTSADGSGIPRYDIEVPEGDVFSLTHSQFNLGLYIRPVTAAGGSTIITGNFCKITVEGLIWPVTP